MVHHAAQPVYAGEQIISNLSIRRRCRPSSSEVVLIVMGWSRTHGSRNVLRQRMMARLRLAALILLIMMFITPLRNMLMPDFLWYRPWYDLSSPKLIRMHLFDLFYYIDRSPYVGDCKHVRQRLEPLKKLRVEDLPTYSVEDFDAGVEKLRGQLSEEDMWKLQFFRPPLTPDEQREMVYTTLMMAQAFDIFNISYFMAEGTLIGIHRHHGMIPWDDDVDLMIKAPQWAQARKVLSCMPGFSLNMARDFMWKFMWNKSKLWRYENFIRFPFIDVFPANEDDEHIWPLTIWMKRDLIWRTVDTYPAQQLPFEGFLVTAPHDPGSILVNHYGPGTEEVCASRIFKRREREPYPQSERVRIPCRYLHHIYPFVFQEKDPRDGSPVQVRKLGGKVLSTFKPQTGELKFP